MAASARVTRPPNWMRDKQARLARIRAAKASPGRGPRGERPGRRRPRPDGSPRPTGPKTPATRPASPSPVRSATSPIPQSRIMKGPDGVQAYNAQAAVDADAGHRRPPPHQQRRRPRRPAAAARRGGENTGSMRARSPPTMASARISGASSSAPCAATSQPDSTWRRQDDAGPGHAPGYARAASEVATGCTKIRRQPVFRTHQAGQKLPAVPPPRHQQR